MYLSNQLEFGIKLLNKLTTKTILFIKDLKDYYQEWPLSTRIPLRVDILLVLTIFQLTWLEICIQSKSLSNLPMEVMPSLPTSINFQWTITWIPTCGKAWNKVSMPDLNTFLTSSTTTLLRRVVFPMEWVDLTSQLSSPQTSGPSKEPFTLLTNSKPNQTMVNSSMLTSSNSMQPTNTSLNPRTTGTQPTLWWQTELHRMLTQKPITTVVSYKESKKRLSTQPNKLRPPSEYTDQLPVYKTDLPSSTEPQVLLTSQIMISSNSLNSVSLNRTPLVSYTEETRRPKNLISLSTNPHPTMVNMLWVTSQSLVTKLSLATQ